MGLAQGKDRGWYAVQMFGRPKTGAIRFRVENPTGHAIEYRASEQAFSLQPRTARTHTICRATQITIAPPSGKQFSKRALSGATYIVAGQDVIEKPAEGR